MLTRRLAFLAPFELVVSNWPGVMMTVMKAIPVFFLRGSSHQINWRMDLVTAKSPP